MKTDAMKIPDLLAHLAGRDIKIWLEDGRLRCNAPAGALTPEFREQLGGRKGEIIGFLNMAAAAVRQQPAIVPLQPSGTCTPIYAVPGHVGAVLSFSDLSRRLGDDQPFFALEPPGLNGRIEPMERVEDIAEYFAGQILEYQPTGPYNIVGHCSGGATAFKLARVLSQRGAEIQCLALFGPLHPSTYQGLLQRLHFHAKLRAGAIARHMREMASLPSFDARLRYLGSRLRNRGDRLRAFLDYVRKGGAKADPVLARRARLKATALIALRHYTPGPYPGRVCIFLPNKAWVRSGAEPLRWLHAVPQAEVYYGPENCYGPLMIEEPDALATAELYRQSIRRVERTP